MAMDAIITFPRLLVLVIIYILAKLARFGSREKHLPLGPSTLPVIGNAHLVVDSNLYRRYDYKGSVGNPS